VYVVVFVDDLDYHALDGHPVVGVLRFDERQGHLQAQAETAVMGSSSNPRWLAGRSSRVRPVSLVVSG
jgi:hypothetical protein